MPPVVSTSFPRVTVAHPHGNANVRGALAGLRAAGQLEQYVTGFGFAENTRWPGLLPSSLRRKVERRRYELPTGLMQTSILGDTLTAATASLRGKRGRASVDELYRRCDEMAARWMQRHWPKQAAGQFVYAYEDGALAALQMARQLGGKAIYELPIGYWRTAHKLFAEEAERVPEWADLLPAAEEPRAKLERKDEEIAAADHVVVASHFTASTLSDYPGQAPSTTRVTYGAPPSRLPSDAPNSFLPARPDEPLRILFVGGLSQRKGLSYLFDTLEAVGTAATLTVVGEGAHTPRLDHSLSKHRYIPTLPHSELLDLMGQHHILLFPTLFEGFGLVILEAMAQGLTVLTTPHSAGPDVLTEGHDGHIVGIRKTESMVEHILRWHDDRDRLDTMRRHAHATAASMTWKAYGEKLAALMTSLYHERVTA